MCGLDSLAAAYRRAVVAASELSGVPADVVDAIRLGKRPTFTSPAEEATYLYLVELMRDPGVADNPAATDEASYA